MPHFYDTYRISLTCKPAYFLFLGVFPIVCCSNWKHHHTFLRYILKHSGNWNGRSIPDHIWIFSKNWNIQTKMCSSLNTKPVVPKLLGHGLPRELGENYFLLRRMAQKLAATWSGSLCCCQEGKSFLSLPGGLLWLKLWSQPPCQPHGLFPWRASYGYRGAYRMQWKSFGNRHIYGTQTV